MSQLFDLALFSYLAASILYIAGLAYKRDGLSRAGTVILTVGGVANTIAIGIMTYRANRIPFTNTFETLVLFSWLIVLAGLAFEYSTKARIIGTAVAPLALLALGYADLQGEVELRPLIPALQSNWLLAHVTSYFIAYAVASVSYALGVVYLLIEQREDGARASSIFGAANIGLVVGGIAYFALHLALARFIGLSPIDLVRERFNISMDGRAVAGALVTGIAAGAAAWSLRGALRDRVPDCERLDRTIDHSIRFSFPFMTIGLVTGAVWANETWGSYWSWDPKETWALITWLVYAAYLHSRLVARWRGRRTVVLAVLGFLVVIFTYFGVNYFLTGLHAYAG